jgi:anti-sigma regulatory factor (Ser/Thr protein kinase)
MVVAVDNTLSEVYPATAESVVDARNLAAEFAAEAGAPSDTVESIRLAVSEAVTNVVLHAYAPDSGSEPKHVQITLAVTGNEMWILVADDGRGHQAAPISPGLGWGLALIADACDDFLITERSGGGTELQMRFGLPVRAGLQRRTQRHRFSERPRLRAD